MARSGRPARGSEAAPGWLVPPAFPPQSPASAPRRQRLRPRVVPSQGFPLSEPVLSLGFDFHLFLDESQRRLCSQTRPPGSTSVEPAARLELSSAPASRHASALDRPAGPRSQRTVPPSAPGDGQKRESFGDALAKSPSPTSNPSPTLEEFAFAYASHGYSLNPIIGRTALWVSRTQR